MKMIILDDVFKRAQDYAKKQKHETVFTLHIFSTLVDSPVIQSLLDRAGCNFSILSTAISQELKNLEQSLSNSQSRLDFSEECLQLKTIAIKKAEVKQCSGVELYHILEAFLEFDDSEVVYALKSSGFKLEYFKKEILNNSENYSQLSENQNPQSQRPDDRSYVSSKNKNNPEGALKDLKWIIDLNEHVKKSFVDPLIGREKEVHDLVLTLAKKKKSNAVLVGEAGVGKTSVVEGFAKLINEGKVPNEIKTYRIFSLDINGVMAQTKYRGEFESKIQDTLTVLKKIPNAVLFIDEVHMIMGANAGSDGALNLANLLKPIMTSGELKFIGATTYKEYSNHFEKDAALTRRFQKIDIDEPSNKDAINILSGLKSSYEKFHKVKIMTESVEAAVNLSVKYIKSKFLPDKAIDVLDEACTMVKFSKEHEQKVVSPEDIRKVISKIAKIPEESLSEDTKKKVETIAQSLNQVIFGQKEAIEKVEETILLAKSGLSNENKPLGSFIFAGPTGVGKTELTNQLSMLMNMSLTRIDMSEYKEEHSVAKLIGAPPGYVGYDQEGILTSAVIKNPHSVILLDEVEKAHPLVMDTLLQILDYGTLTDSKGKKADFRQSIIVCTTNTGTEELSKAVIGITEAAIKSQRDPLESLKNSFRPEFINRFDNIIWFNSLTKENIKSVLYKQLSLLEASLSSKNIKITLSPEAEEFIINKGFSPKYGARPMERAFTQEVKIPLSREIIYGKLQSGGSITVLMEDNKLTFKVKTLKAKKIKDKNGITI